MVQIVKNNHFEKKIVLRIYMYLLALIIIDPLFNKFILNTTILRSLELVCMFLIVKSELQLYIGKKVILYNGFLKFLLFALLLITLGIILRGEWDDLSVKDFVLKVIGDTKIWILPFLILPLPNFKYYKEILQLFNKASLFVIPIWILNSNLLVQLDTYKGEHIGVYLPFLSAFLLGFLPLFRKKEKYFVVSIWAIYFMLMLLNARRNVSLSLALYAFIAYIFSILHNIKRRPAKYLFICVFTLISFLFLQLNVDRLAANTFSNIAHRGIEDSRSQVEILFFWDFSHSPTTDWIYGRGMDGGYAQAVTNEETGETTYNRKIIETGYLNMMLKGGIIYDLVILLLIITSLKGVFKKNNPVYVKYSGVILATYFLDMYTTNPICDFTTRSMLFWFLISFLLQFKKV